MTRFIEQAIHRAGLGEVIPARQRGDVDGANAIVRGAGQASPGAALDLLVLGALADAIRDAECGAVVRVHPDARSEQTPAVSSEAARVAWVAGGGGKGGKSDLELLRTVAMERVTGPIGVRVGVDWGDTGMELAQVALGFGATDLSGPITRKNGLLIGEDELRKVKGKGMVAASALKRREISALVRNAGRECEFTDGDDHDAVGHSNEDDGNSREAAHA